MTQLVWDDTGNRLFETGIDKAVLYVMDENGAYPLGVPWNGLSAITESPSGAEPTPLYADNIKYLTLMSSEEFAATLEAYAYPEEFGECDGSRQNGIGLFISQQLRKKFALVYRTKLGNDVDGQDFGYKLHLLYGCLSSPSEKAYATVNDSPEAITFSWEISTTPTNVTGFQPTSLIIIDSTQCTPGGLHDLENQLFGSVGVTANLPLPDGVKTILETASEWYIDSVNGNDSYTGKTNSDPFKTVAKLLTVWEADESVGVARGSVFYETIQYPGSGSVAVAYGTGSEPKFDCSEIATVGMWSKTGGQTNVYQITPTVDYLIAYGAFQSIWENDIRLMLAASLVACDSTPGTYFVVVHSTTTPTIYVHATGSDNPAVNGNVYRYAKRNFGIWSENYPACGVNGLEACRNLSESGAIRVGRSSLLIDCISRDGNKHNIFYSDGCYLDGVQALDAYFANQSISLFVYNENTPINLGLTHIDCVADADTDGSTYISGSSGFYGHKNVSGNFGAITFSGCQAKHCYIGFEGDSATSFSYVGCIGTQCYQIFAARSSTPIIYTFTSCVQTVADALTFSVIFNDTLDGHIFNVTSCNWNFTGFAGGGGAIYSTGKDMTVNLNGNTFTIGTSWKSAVIGLDGGAVTLYARNNSYQRTGAVTVVVYTLLDAGSTIDSDYNTFGHADMQFNIPAGIFSTLALYQAGTGQDLHSVVG